MWTSPLGALAVSFSLVHEQGSVLPHVQYLVALALVRAVTSLTGGDTLGLRLKWPNDIYAETGEGEGEGEGGKAHKVGGILCQAAWDGERFQLVVGLGVNVSNEAPSTSLHALALRRAGVAGEGGIREQLTRENILAGTLNAFEGMHAQLERDGFSPFLEEYLRLWLHSYLFLPLVSSPLLSLRFLSFQGPAGDTSGRGGRAARAHSRPRSFGLPRRARRGYGGHP